MNEKTFFEELKKIGIELNDIQLEQFRSYSKFLLEYNAHTNLTAIKTLEEVYLKHFFDSLLACKYFDFSNKSIIDIGSGAGFPGVPLKIVFPNIDLTLLDSNGKKTVFLEQLKDKLNIEYKVVNDRAENYVKQNREVYDIATGRAVTAMPVLSELLIPFVKVGGHFIAYKGKIDETLENGRYAIEVLGGEIEQVFEDELPIENSKRVFIVVNKKCKTDVLYPRLFDKINKKPLQKKQ